MAKTLLLCLILILFILPSCNSKKKEIQTASLETIQKGADMRFKIQNKVIRENILKKCQLEMDTCLQDSLLSDYYKGESPLMWLIENNANADTLIYWLENSHLHGLNPEIFSTSNIKHTLKRVRTLDLRTDENINTMLAELEYSLTKSYIKYVCGMKYGFIQPQQILNDQEDVKDLNKVNTKQKTRWYDIPLEQCSKEVLQQLIDTIHIDAPQFLRSIQPNHPFYMAMQKEYQQWISLTDTVLTIIPSSDIEQLKEGDTCYIVPFITQRLKKTGELSKDESITPSNQITPPLMKAINRFRAKNSLPMSNEIGQQTIGALNRPASYYFNRLKINMERMRWKPIQKRGKKYIVANTAAYMLQAVNEENDSVLEMRICCGSKINRTPLLSQTIRYIETNPYWNVPKSIIRKEIIPAYKRDSTYLKRNRFKVYDRQGKQIDPHTIQWTKYKGDVPFDIKQDNKEGNSLGRLIFRFPNPYAIYLHDTPSRWAFMKTNRAVSHGCVRLEQALNLALFLIDHENEVTQDRIRVAIDLPALSEKGKEVTQKLGYKDIKHYSLKEPVPLYIDYYTMYLSAKRTLSYCNDEYQYDAPLLIKLNQVNEIN